MDSGEYPSHLRPVPESGDSTAPVLQPEEQGTPGLNAPLAAGSLQRVRHRRPGRPRVRTGGTRAAGDRRGAHRGRRRSAAARAGPIDGDQLSRAVAERYGLDQIDLSAYPGRHGGGEPDLGQHGPPLRRCRSASSTRRRCSSRWPIRPTCSRSTTSRSRPASTAGSPSPPGGHRVADRSPQHAAERRQRGDHRRRGGSRGEIAEVTTWRSAPRTRR